MIASHDRVIAIIDPLPAGESTLRQVITLLSDCPVRELLWVTLTGGDEGLLFASSHVPFLTPDEWREKTERQLEMRLRALTAGLDLPRWSFRLLAGSPNRAMARLSASWNADLILAPREALPMLQGLDAPAWLLPPQPLTGRLHPLPDQPGVLHPFLALLKRRIDRSPRLSAWSAPCKRLWATRSPTHPL
ncbi:MAG: hypothetical protein HQL95_13925 [Magnetococcales bacterium]|nr:hypothetical protein [Magnetococcales bacterium]